VHREADIRAQETIARMQARGLGTPPSFSFSFSTIQLSTRSRSSLYPWLYTHDTHTTHTRHTRHPSQNLACRTTRRCWPRPPVQPESRPRSRP
jgi:hypothetical protein